MSHTIRHKKRILSNPLVMVFILCLALIPAASVEAKPLEQPSSITVELTAIADARTQAGSGDVNFPSGFLWIGTENGHRTYINFDLSVLPANATIDAATLRLEATGNNAGSRNIEVGRVDGPWHEADDPGRGIEGITWNNQPDVTWGGPVQAVDAADLYEWNVLPLVQAWQSGTQPQYGFGVRGLGEPNTLLKQFYAKDNDPTRGPRLEITYSRPADDDQPYPDLGDAPDSLDNHHNIINTAYIAGAVAGNFPTVWDTPVGQPAGPRHANQTYEGILGQYLSREAEADIGPDQDAPNNILRHSVTGIVADVADNDRGDDGWRNRNIKFFDCRKQTLTVRVSKGPNATKNRMYLNVWFDGNRDGDWQDIAPCQPSAGAPNEASYEWIVQDHIIDMTAIPAGGYLDFQVDTERVLNITGGKPHWMRFTLSESRAVQPNDVEFPDGRGPHPSNSPIGFEFGETEDIFQLPPPRGDDGELILEKRVLNADAPVPFAGTVTYQIRLRHEGGSQPIEAEIRDKIPYPQHINAQVTPSGGLDLIIVESPTGGVSPLEATLDYDNTRIPIGEQVVSWQGTLNPNSEVTLDFDVHVHPFCDLNEQTQTITNLAEARPVDGDSITAEVSFTAQCPWYSRPNIEISDEPRDNILDLSDVTQVTWEGSVRNRHTDPVTLGFYQLPTDANQARMASQPRILERITLAADEQKQVTLVLRNDVDLQENLSLPVDTDITLQLGWCFLHEENNQCPDANEHPQLHGEVLPISYKLRPNDLGDAPDSSNHFVGTQMAAYPGIVANFPTVFDPTTGLPEGPRHGRPRHFHLGPQVSREAEADTGPDQDGANNINPPGNVADLDWFDDGSMVTNLVQCQPATADVQVAISPQAVAWFQENEREGYLNIWLDSNHDGDWEDGFTCQDENSQAHEVVEHILIDYPINVVGLGPGLHNLPNILTDRIPWPANGSQQRHWVRFTLSEQKSNKTKQFGSIEYGDGRGYPTPFRTGETEDYLLYPAGDEGNGPDMAIQLDGRVEGAAAEEKIRYKIDTINRGSQSANDPVITFNKPSQLHGQEANLVLGPGIQPGDVSQSDTDVTIALPNMPIGASRSILLGFTNSIAARSVSAAESYTADVQITTAGDVDTSNNSASATISRANRQAMAGGLPGNLSDLWSKRDLTCNDTFDIGIRGEKGQTVEILLDGDAVGNLLMTDETMSYEFTNLDDGSHQYLVRYENGIVSPRDAASGLPSGKFYVDQSLPFDPMSLTFTDGQGNEIHPPTLGWSNGNATPVIAYLETGKAYQISLNSCGDVPNARFIILLPDGTPIHLTDADEDGEYTGSFTYDTTARSTHMATASLRLMVSANGSARSFAITTVTADSGVVRDAASNQPIADVSVTALAGNAILPSSLTSSENPQITSSDGAFGFTVDNGIYQLDASHSAYQPYRSGDIDADSGALATDIAMTPAVNEPATHVIHITDQGFEPAVVTAYPGDVIMWTNADLTDHSTVHATDWDSGVLSTGASYKIKVNAVGNYTYQDDPHSSNSGLIIVPNGPTQPGDKMLFLPFVTK